MADTRRIAHLVRRLTFGPRPAQVERLAALGEPAALADLLAARPQQLPQPSFGTDDDFGVMRTWYLDALRGDGADLHERIVWFWHGHLTSGLAKVEPQLMYRQQLTMREHAVGNFRTLLSLLTVDGAMLLWLDGNGSRADAPNENYARELMELFALGRGNYTEDDVKAAARALGGYSIDYDNSFAVAFDPSGAASSAQRFLGRDVRSPADVVNAVCDHPACAPWIASRLFAALVGRPSTQEETARFANVFRAADLEVLPLVEAIVTDPAFFEGFDDLDQRRPKFPLEWFITAERFVGARFDEWYLAALGQVPLEPPNVAGWPASERLLSASSTMARAQFAYINAVLLDRENPPDDDELDLDALFQQAGLDQVSDPTRRSISGATKNLGTVGDQVRMARALIVCSPEFCVQ